MKALLKVLVVGMVMLMVGCASYNSAISPLQWGTKKLTNAENIRVYVKPYTYDSCTGSAIAIWRFCGKGQLEDFIITALKDENIITNSLQNGSNVIIETLDVEFGRHLTGFKTTSKFKVNGFNITIVAKVYDRNFWHVFTKNDEINALTASAKVLAKLVKNNIGGDGKIEIAIDQEKGRMIQYKDNTGL